MSSVRAATQQSLYKEEGNVKDLPVLNLLLLFFSLSFRSRTTHSMCFETIFSIVFTRLFSSVCPSPTRGFVKRGCLLLPVCVHTRTYIYVVFVPSIAVGSDKRRQITCVRLSNCDGRGRKKVIGVSLSPKKKRTNPETARKGRKYIRKV